LKINPNKNVFLYFFFFTHVVRLLISSIKITLLFSVLDICQPAGSGPSSSGTLAAVAAATDAAAAPRATVAVVFV
jgi:hypothetical protein